MTAPDDRSYEAAPHYPRVVLSKSQIPDGYVPLAQVCEKVGLAESWVMSLIFEEAEPDPILADIEGKGTIMVRPADLYSYIQHFLPYGVDLPDPEGW